MNVINAVPLHNGSHVTPYNNQIVVIFILVHVDWFREEQLTQLLAIQFAEDEWSESLTDREGQKFVKGAAVEVGQLARHGPNLPLVEFVVDLVGFGTSKGILVILEASAFQVLPVIDL